MATNFGDFGLGGVTIKGVPLHLAHPGRQFWVAPSTDTTTPGSDSNEGSFDRPWATVAAAVVHASVVANRGDIIFVKPGVTETVAAAGGVTMSKAGVALVCLGTGSKRTTFNLTATTSTFLITAANCTVVNLLITGGIDAIVSHTVISVADVSLINCEYRDVTGECVDGLLTTAGADRLYINNYRHDGATTAGTNAGIAIVGGDRIVIDGLIMDGDFAVGGIDVRTTLTTDLEVRNVPYFRTRNSVDIFIIDTITGSTGQIGPNLYLRVKDNAANITEACTGATFVYHLPISIVNLAGEAGMQSNITASTDA